MTLMLTNPTTV